MASVAADLLGALDAFLEAAAWAHVADHKGEATARIERRLHAALRRAFRRQGQVFLHRLATLDARWPAPTVGAVHEAREAAGDSSAAWLALFNAVWDATTGETRQLFVEPITAAHRAALLAGGAAMAGQLELADSFTLAHPAAVAWLRDRAAERVTAIDETTREQLRALLVRGLDEGWSYQQTARAIRQAFAGFSGAATQRHVRTRAELVAITETGDAYEAAGLAVAQGLARSGLTMEKRWLPVSDSRVCPKCRENADAGWIDLGEAFPTGVDRPLQHPGCRCTMQSRRRSRVR